MNVLRISRRRRVAGVIAAVVTLVTAAGIVAAAPPANAWPWPYQLLNRYSYMCLDVVGFDSSDGATIGQWSCNGASNQNWYFDHVSGVYDGNDVWRIRSEFSGKCMDVAWASYQPGARVIQYTCHGGLNQQFISRRVDMTGSGNWVATLYPVAAPHLCLDVLGANQEYGAPLGLWPCNGAYNQQFIAEGG